MASYYLGTKVTLRVTVLNEQKLPTTADSVVATITPPNGQEPITSPFSPTATVGVYTFAYTPAAVELNAGEHGIRAVATNPNTSFQFNLFFYGLKQ